MNINFSSNFSYTSTLSLLGYSPEAMLATLKSGLSAGYDAGFQDGLMTGMGMAGLGPLMPSAADMSSMMSLLGQFSPQQLQGFGVGSIPQPQVNMSGPPAGKGLEKNPAGWPEGSVKTAGGYTVVPEGNTNWKVYGPDQKPGDKPITEVSGDPHVHEKDGGKWDFTKNSDFVLPDGTRINCKTSSENGQSVSTGLEITNGADHVSVTGLDGKPTVSDVKYDGYEHRAQHLAENPNRDSYRLGGDGDDWFLERGGQNLGEVTGAHYDAKTNRYEQETNGQPYQIDPNLKPPFGSEAWGNMLRNESLDFIASRLGLDPATARSIGQMFHSEHSTSQYMQGLQQLSGFMGPFGGLRMMFEGPGAAFKALGNMSDAMNSLMSLNRDLLMQRYGMMNL